MSELITCVLSAHLCAEWFCSPVELVGGEPVTVMHYEYLVSDTLHTMVDKMCFLAVYWSKGVFQTKVPATTRAQFHKYITDLHKGDNARRKFADAWEEYVRANQPARDIPDETTLDQYMIAAFGLDNDEDTQPTGAGAGVGAAGAVDTDAATPRRYSPDPNQYKSIHPHPDRPGYAPIRVPGLVQIGSEILTYTNSFFEYIPIHSRRRDDVFVVLICI